MNYRCSCRQANTGRVPAYTLAAQGSLAAAVLLDPAELLLDFRCVLPLTARLCFGREILYTHAGETVFLRPYRTIGFFPSLSPLPPLPDRVHHPISALPPENLITRAFVRKGPLSRPRRVVFRSLCVCLLSPLPSRTKAFFFRYLLVRLRDLPLDCDCGFGSIAPPTSLRIIPLTLLLETFNETFFKFFRSRILPFVPMYVFY